MPRGKAKRKKKDAVNAGIRQGKPIAPDGARGGSGGADPSKSGSGGADGTIGASARKRGAEPVQGRRNVKCKSSSDEDGSSSSSSSTSISPPPDDSLAPGAGNSASALGGEACLLTPRSSSPPTHDSVDENLRIYRKEAFEDSVKSNKFKTVSRDPRPIGGQCTRDLRPTYSSTAEDSVSAGSESTSSKSSAKSYSSYCEAVSLGGSSSKTVGQKIGKRGARISGSPTWEGRISFLKMGVKACQRTALYVVAGEDHPYYPAQLKAMKDRGGCFELTVKFEHILKENKQLALNILRRSHLCKPCVIQFMLDHQFGTEAEVTDRATIHMFHMPTSIKPLKEILKDKESLLTWVKNILNLKNMSVRILTELAQALLTGFLEEVRRQHKEGKSWNGEYNIGDMFLIDGCDCRIIKEPYDYLGSGAAGQSKSDSKNSFKHPRKKVTSFDMARVEDVKGLEKIFSSELLFDANGNKEKDAAVPVFYQSLQQTMSNISPRQVKSEKFWTFLLNHPALKPPIVRNSLILFLKTILCDDAHNLNDQLKGILDMVLETDWRELACNLEIFKDVYCYEAEEDKRKKGNSCQVEEESKPKKHEDTESNKQCQNDQFDNTFSGILIFNRNFLQHANRVVKVSDPTQLEIFFSSHFKYLPKLLLSLVNLDDKNKICVADAWEMYASYKAQFKNATKYKKTLSFW